MKTAIERAHEAAARAEYEHGDEYYGTWDTLDASLKEYAIQKARAANLAFLSSLAEDEEAVEGVAAALYATKPWTSLPGFPEEHVMSWQEAKDYDCGGYVDEIRDEARAALAALKEPT